MNEEAFNTYDFLINDEDEAMLLLYAREGSPDNPVFEIDTDNKSALLIRNDNDSVSLNEIPDEILDAMQDADKLLVCELSISEDEKDTQITYAYEAEITD